MLVTAQNLNSDIAGAQSVLFKENGGFDHTWDVSCYDY